VHLAPQDLVVFVGFFVVVVGLSVWKSRQTSGPDEESSTFFLAGRGLTWPLIGISIVAANISTEQLVGMAGQAAGSTGLAVSCWQLLGSIFIVVIAITLLPKFLRAGIYTMPEYLEYRYNAAARGVMAALTVVIYVVVMLPAVLYSGGVTLRAITGMELAKAVWLIGMIGAGYSVIGGLKAIAWADLIQGLALLAAGLLIFALGLHELGGWKSFTTANAQKLHLILPAANRDLPWTGVAGGMWIVMIYYCGLNQFIVQRNLAAKSLKHGQLGMIFAGGLWLLVPFAIVMPGLMAQQLYGDKLAKSTDAAFPVMVTQLVSPGLRGFTYAAIAGAVTSTLASLLNSASTIATMDVYRRMFHEHASQRSLVWSGRCLTAAFVLAGCAIAPMLDDERFGGVFQYIQQFQGYIWPGVVAAFLIPMLVPKVPEAAGVGALVLGPLAYAALQFTARSTARPAGHDLHFLIQVLLAFAAVAIVMIAWTALAPRSKPQELPVREDVALDTERVVYLAGGLVLLGVLAFFVVFW
jgi:solute:Na+ symporter, SSS family